MSMFDEGENFGIGVANPSPANAELIACWREHQAMNKALREMYPEVDPACNVAHCRERDAHDLLVEQTIAALRLLQAGEPIGYIDISVVEALQEKIVIAPGALTMIRPAKVGDCLVAIYVAPPIPPPRKDDHEHV